MIYSGADLIRTSGLQAERMDRLAAKADGPDAVKAPSAPENPTSNLDEQTQGALLRFARFINKEKRPPKKRVFRSGTANPYAAAEALQEKLFSRGRSLDVYV